MDEQMEGIFAGVNEEVERRGKLFVEQSKDAIGDISSFFVAVRPTHLPKYSFNLSNLGLLRLIGRNRGFKDFYCFTSVCS